MIVQLRCPDKAHVFAASSIENEEQARLEVLRWAIGHGYRLVQPSRPFIIYHDDRSVREWVLLERAVTDSASDIGH